MKSILATIAAAVIFLSGVPALNAQGSGNDIYWHIDPSVKSCSMVIDPSLTQAQWRTFVEQVGAISSFKPLASARPLGVMRFSVGIDRSYTPVDQHNPAWINTFTHPDEDCPLGDAISVPTIRARMGVTDDLDIGAYWTHAPNANYGMVGGEVRYQVSQESENLPAVALRGSVTVLTGVADYDLNVYGLEVMASKEIAFLTPYAGCRGLLAVGRETTTKVDLATERPLFAQGYAGVSYAVWILNFAAEYDISYVNTLGVIAGVNF